MVQKVLCVAEKTSVAKAVANHLSGGRYQTRQTRNKYIKNYDFDYKFGSPYNHCHVTMTAVSGHTEDLDFTEPFRSWRGCDVSTLFDAPVMKTVQDDKKSILQNIKQEARGAKILFIWTDCDREGEYIGTEVRSFALSSNRQLEIIRAKFSNTERSHVIRAAQNPVQINENQAAAVKARMEIDLRIGAIFTRFQTLKLQEHLGLAQGSVISYGSCQFPTLGFVVDRFKRVKNFVSEPFWTIKISDRRENKSVQFQWNRNRLFDRLPVVVLFERCIGAEMAKITNVSKKPARKLKPLPLTTVELQKHGSRCLGMNSQAIMKAAEKLYTDGFISYPRTETDQFDSSINLKALIEKQLDPSNFWRWDPFVQGLLRDRFRQPRRGQNNDKAHPPIHPVTFATPSVLNNDQKKVYEYVVCRFLACCSEDALGETSSVNVEFGGEGFHTSGLRVIARNYLDVYKWDRWESTQLLPSYEIGERFTPSEAIVVDGKTTAPHFLTEPELIGLMNANGIGTDATMAEHIEKIQIRDYVVVDPPNGRIRHFIPSNLGFALVEAYDTVASDLSLSKPFLRKEVSYFQPHPRVWHMKALLLNNAVDLDGNTDEKHLRRRSLSRTMYTREYFEIP